MQTRGKQASSDGRRPRLREISPRALARRLIRRREELGLTRAALAQRAGVAVRDVVGIEASGELSNVNAARALAEVYGVPFLVLQVWHGLVKPEDLQEFTQWEGQHHGMCAKEA